MERKEITQLKNKLRKYEYIPQTDLLNAIEFLQGSIKDLEDENRRLIKMIEDK